MEEGGQLKGEENQNHQIKAIYRMRFYQNEFPAVGELVMGQATMSEQNGSYAELLEYDHKVGMIPINQYTTTMKKAIHRAMKVGKKEILSVIRVDEEKGYIDLSKVKVKQADETEGLEKYTRASTIHSMLIHISEATETPILELYKTIVWPLYRRGEKEHNGKKHPLIYFKEISLNEDKINDLGLENQKIRQALLSDIKRRFKASAVKMVASFEVTVKKYDGINIIKRVLKKGVQAAKQREYDVNVSMIGSPLYHCQVSTPSKSSSEEALKITLETISKEMLKEGGEYSLDKEPKIIGDSNEYMEELMNANKHCIHSQELNEQSEEETQQ